ncbi:Hypothetical protein R9X50_00052600 [Acrodontium crateriforme]|uniref:Yeast cell wall synthesis Kre9/Knh1-like N-terminal domain-containing protein n=1 Tax=Acrodontium crateriforme TaxID=150365 RepID=A0AAQ3M0T7_9PEZI|nr:Hypothetical protein R9X50_00052600 [Acrodontium crateriforme]
MLFVRSLFLTLGAVAALAQSLPNPFNVPQGNYVNTEAGTDLALSWKPTTQGTVSLVLRSGNAGFLSAGTVIASKIDNTGSYTWSIPKDIVRGASYAIEIVDDADPTQVNYTPQFNINSDVTVASTSMSTVTEGASTTGTASASSMTGSTTSMSMTTSMTTSSGSSSSTGSSSSSGSSSSVTSTQSSSSAAAASSGAGASNASSGNSAPRATAMAGLLGVAGIAAFVL